MASIPTDKGVFKRAAAAFRNHIAKGSKEFPPEPNRYHLYLSEACPWCHRTDLMLKLKGLDHVITTSHVDPHMGDKGWSFTKENPDPIHPQYQHVSQIYFAEDPGYKGRFTVPVLFDKQNKRMVSNESSEILRMFNTEFNDFAKHKELDFYPTAHKQKIDEINDWVYNDFNNGVYQCGFSTSQEAYEDAVTRVFQAADKLDGILAKSKFLVGDKMTEADVRAFPTALRFDNVYAIHFKASVKQMREYTNIWRWMKEMYHTPGVKDTIDMPKIVEHYYWSHVSINPHRIIPKLTFTTTQLEKSASAAL